MPWIDKEGNIRSIDGTLLMSAEEYKKECEESDKCKCKVPRIIKQFGYRICMLCCSKVKEEK